MRKIVRDAAKRFSNWCERRFRLFLVLAIFALVIKSITELSITFENNNVKDQLLIGTPPRDGVGGEHRGENHPVGEQEQKVVSATIDTLRRDNQQLTHDECPRIDSPPTKEHQGVNCGFGEWGSLIREDGMIEFMVPDNQINIGRVQVLKPKLDFKKWKSTGMTSQNPRPIEALSELAKRARAKEIARYIAKSMKW